MGGLYGNVGIPLRFQTGHGLGNAVDIDAPGAEFFQNHAAGKGTADLPAGEFGAESVFHSRNRFL